MQDLTKNPSSLWYWNPDPAYLSMSKYKLAATLILESNKQGSSSLDPAVLANERWDLNSMYGSSFYKQWWVRMANIEHYKKAPLTGQENLDQLGALSDTNKSKREPWRVVNKIISLRQENPDQSSDQAFIAQKLTEAKLNHPFWGDENWGSEDTTEFIARAGLIERQLEKFGVFAKNMQPCFKETPHPMTLVGIL